MSRRYYFNGTTTTRGRGINRTVYVVHGWDMPWTTKRSTDNLETRLRQEGYQVREINYSMYDPTSIFLALIKINGLSANDVVIGHSMGGILNDLSGTRAKHIDVATLHSDIKGTNDWLIGTSDKWVKDGTHGVDQYTDLILDALDLAFNPLE